MLNGKVIYFVIATKRSYDETLQTTAHVHKGFEFVVIFFINECLFTFPRNLILMFYFALSRIQLNKKFEAVEVSRKASEVHAISSR